MTLCVLGAALDILSSDLLSKSTTSGPKGGLAAIISPLLADANTKDSARGLVYPRNDIAGEIIISSDGAGSYGYNAGKLDGFQPALNGPVFSAPYGEAGFGSFYKDMPWETGGAGGGSGGGSGVTPASVGIGDGASNGEIPADPMQDGIPGFDRDHHVQLDPSLPPVKPIPEPGTLLLLGSGLAGLGFFRRKVGKSAA